MTLIEIGASGSGCLSTTFSTISLIVVLDEEDETNLMLRPAAITVHESVIRMHIKPEIGNIRLTQLSPAHLRNLYSRKLKFYLSKRAVKYIHTVIRRSLSQALNWGLVARNVAEAVQVPQPYKKGG
jgi:integrase